MAERGVWDKLMAYLGLTAEAQRRPPRRHRWVGVVLAVLAVMNVITCITRVGRGDYIAAAFAGVTAVVMFGLFMVTSGRISGAGLGRGRR